MNLDLTPADIARIQAALLATCVTGGGSPTFTLIRKLVEQTGIQADLDDTRHAAERCIDEAIEGGDVVRVEG